MVSFLCLAKTILVMYYWILRFTLWWMAWVSSKIPWSHWLKPWFQED